MPLFTKVLVTGGAGCIGSALVWALNQRGIDNILISDRLGSGPKWRNLVPLRFVDFLEAERLRASLDTSLAGVSLILHMGACSSTTEADAGYLLDNNYRYTCELARWALARGVRFVYASSAATYGGGEQGMDDRSEGLERFRPLNPYGYSKQLFDLQARREGWLEHIVGCKFFNVFGPNEDHKGAMRSVVHKAYSQIIETGRVQLFRSYRSEVADGAQQRDFLYLKDAVEMTLHLAQSGAAGLFNLGSGKAHSWLELIGAVYQALGKAPEIEFIDMPQALRGAYQYYTRADLGRLLASGYARPITPLDRAVADYVGYLVADRRLGD